MEVTAFLLHVCRTISSTILDAEQISLLWTFLEQSENETWPRIPLQ